MSDPFPVAAPEPEAESKPKPKPKRKAHEISPEARAKMSAGGAAGRRASSQKAILADVRISIAEGLAKAGALAVPIAPLPGGYCIATAEEAADVICRLAERNPSLLASLAKASVGMDYVAAGSWIVGLGVAIAAQYGRLPVDSPLAQRFGVAEVYEAMVAEGTLAEAVETTEDTNHDERAVPVPDLLAAVGPPAER